MTTYVIVYLLFYVLITALSNLSAKEVNVRDDSNCVKFSFYLIVSLPFFGWCVKWQTELANNRELYAHPDAIQLTVIIAAALGVFFAGIGILGIILTLSTPTAASTHESQAVRVIDLYRRCEYRDANWRRCELTAHSAVCETASGIYKLRCGNHAGILRGETRVDVLEYVPRLLFATDPDETVVHES